MQHGLLTEHSTLPTSVDRHTNPKLNLDRKKMDQNKFGDTQNGSKWIETKLKIKKIN